MAVELIGVKELQADISSAQQAMPRDVEGAMTVSLLLIERDARANVKQDTRALMGSIGHTISVRGDVLTGKVGPSKRYGYWVEFGRAPGKMPPLEAVAGWARRHGISPFLVARAIGRKGTKAQPFMLPAFEKNERRIFDLFAQVGEAVVARMKGRYANRQWG